VSAVRWGMLSTASIGRVIAAATRTAERAEFVAAASRDAARAERFADELGLAVSFGSYEELLAADDVDAIYVALPVSMHTEWTVKALEAGKHVLCEKPFAMTAADATRCFDAAEAARKLCVEGFMYRHHPQTTLARRLLADGAIGELAYLRSALTVSTPPTDIRRSVPLGGGALLDLGCYCVSATRLFGGEPERVYAESIPDGPGGVDLRFTASLRLPGNVLAQFDAGLDLPRRDELELVGTNGKLTIPDPWLCRPGYIELERDGRTERLDVDPSGEFRLSEPDLDAYRIEFETASAAILDGTPPSFGRTDAVAQAHVIEALRDSSRDARPLECGKGVT
jgi:xylose dehydrogenase (NAD/NADP)